MVETSVRETLEKVRRALRRGKRGMETLPFHLALESLAAEFRALGGPEVNLSFRPDGESVADLSPRVREALFRTVQEALTNAVRHGKARRVVIRRRPAGRGFTLPSGTTAMAPMPFPPAWAFRAW